MSAPTTRAPAAALATRALPPMPPIEALARLRALPYPWLLESALRSERLGRFSFAGADPYLVLRARGRRLEIDCRRAVHPGLTPGRRSAEGDPFEAVRALLPRLPREAGPDVPFVGGAVVAFGYELAEQLERLELSGHDDLLLPDAIALFVDRVLVWDHVAERLLACGLGFGEDAAAARAAADLGVDRLVCATKAPAPADPPPRAHPATRPFAFFDEASYAKAVALAREEIEAGNAYQVCLTHRLERPLSVSPWALYGRLRRTNPAPFACYLELPEIAVVGSSPERFLRVDRDGAVESRPIKGTAQRGRCDAEDAARRDALARSEKDRAENLMIVDLVRNDLGRVCGIGSVDVPELMAIEAYASVFQMVSTVTGRLRPDRDALDAVRAAFPPGSMTGAPKIAAMRILAGLEPVRRGLYSGAIGHLDARGGADLSVVIRTLFARDGRAYLHVGGGVVADSDPVAEYLETLDKARPLLAALETED